MKVLTENSPQLASDEALEWLILLQSPTLSAAQEKAFFRWLNQAPEHQLAFISAEAIWQRGGALSKTQRTNNRAFTQSASRSWSGWLSGWAVGGLAGVCAVLVVFFSLNIGPVEQDQNFRTTFGEQKRVELQEGSVITLNANSDIEVNLASSDSRALTLKSGEVFFEVSHNKKRPFTVVTDEGLVVVLGTKFSVSKRGGHTEVTVIEGRVGLLPNEDHWEGQDSKVVLLANQQMALDATVSVPKTVNADSVLAWRKGQLHFEGEVLLDVIKALNNYYDREISLETKELEEKRVVAVFPLNRDFESNLNHLKQSLQLDSRQAANGAVTLFKKKG